MRSVAVVGQIARDLVVEVEHVPEAGGSTPIERRREVLGGKGGNQAVGCRQLGCEVWLLSAVGQDPAGEQILAQARRDGLDVADVVRREGTATSLLIDVIGPPGTRRLLEHVDPGVEVTGHDVRAHADRLEGADAVLLQLQQPGGAIRAALEAASGGPLIMADGAPADDETRRAVLSHAHGVRADASEAEALVGWAPAGAQEAVRAARQLLDQGPQVVALATPTGEDVVAWEGGHVVIPHLSADVQDATGGGDAFISGLTAALARGQSAETAAWWAASASALVVLTPGGRPDMSLPRLRLEALRNRSQR